MSEETTKTDAPALTSGDAPIDAPVLAVADVSEGDLPPPVPPPRDVVAEAEALLRKFLKVSSDGKFAWMKDGMQHMAAVLGESHPAVDALRAALAKMFDDA